jgi:hypothetical protein
MVYALSQAGFERLKADRATKARFERLRQALSFKGDAAGATRTGANP